MRRVALLRGPEVLPEALFAAWLPRLPGPRRERLERLPRADARRSLAGELLARLLLSQATGRPAASFRILPGPNGKPYIPDSHWQLSVSHTRGAAACVLSPQPIGLDIERPGRGRPVILRRYFTPTQAAWAGDDPTRFCVLWTRMEAACKRSGAGLSGFAVTDTAKLGGELATSWAGALCLSVCAAPGGPFAVEPVWLDALPWPE